MAGPVDSRAAWDVWNPLFDIAYYDDGIRIIRGSL